MKKLERMRKLKEKLRDEEIEKARGDAASIGLDFVDHELPPDEVDEKLVKRSLITSLRSIIPYTNEWYEAKAAEEEMDDLKKIRIEKVKADDLYTMTKTGRYEEALENMMSETNYDFFYFNKLKMKMENEGKFHFEVPKKANVFADFEKGANRNRLKRAINAVNSFMDESMTNELTRIANLDEKISRKFANDGPCIWRGKSKDGENLKCDNARMRKPDKKGTVAVVTNSSSGYSSRKDKEAVIDYYQFCCFHIPFCCSGNHENNGENVKIKAPNDLGFCAECFMLKMKMKPPPMSCDICPGVVPITLLSGTKAKFVKSSVDDELSSDGGGYENESEGFESGIGSGKQFGKKKRKKEKNPLLCQWIPNPTNEKLRIYECFNERVNDFDTNHRLPNCAWHLAKCIRVHPQGTNPIITVPNEYGLCSMHYLAEYGVHPPFVELPYPGMKARTLKDFWKTLPRHFAVPSIPYTRSPYPSSSFTASTPPPDIMGKDYYPPTEPESFAQIMRNIAKYAAYKRRYYLFSIPAAIRIQSTYRMYHEKNVHLLLKDQKMKHVRCTAAITIQTQIRRFLFTKYMRQKRKLYNDCATMVQRIFRGYFCRSSLRIDWAAKRLTKFMKLLHFFKFRDTVIMVMQIRRLFIHRTDAAIEIQRVIRGFAGRLFVFRKRYYDILSFHSLRKIQRWYRFHHERRNRKPWNPPSEEWALKQCSKKLSRLLCELYLDSKGRKRLMITMNDSAPDVQRLIRGFLGKKGKQKLSYLRNAFRSWMKPYYAVGFMKEFLKQSFYDHYSLRFSKPTSSLQIKKTENTKFFLRSFLSLEKQKKIFEIDKKSFIELLYSWYDSISLPLMETEKEAILRRFKNPVSNSMLIKSFDEYISFHQQPCRKHGRRICGDCYYYKNCQISSCSCLEYIKNKSHSSGICSSCSHPKNLHSVAPLQLRIPLSFTGENKMTLLNLLSFQTEADMSLPVGVQGVSVENVMIPLLENDDIRSEIDHTIERNRKTLQEQSFKEQSTDIVKGLSTCMIEGNSIVKSNAYWQQYSTSAVQPQIVCRPCSNVTNKDNYAVTSMNMDETVYEKVIYDPRQPSYSMIGYQEFWNIVSENPNKTIEDYHERFDHNIPVPIISHGELVYSFEGSSIYFNILHQIIEMKEEMIDYDNPIFLKLVMDHIQIFERHWRKMVVDIRTGKLDSKLTISKESRLIFESSNFPRPSLANKLDSTFRLLGFHKKVLGKDITIRAYAQKKETAIAVDRAKSPLKRKRSLPFIAANESILSMSRIGTAVTHRTGTSLSVTVPLKSPSRQISTATGRNSQLEPLRPLSDEGGRVGSPSKRVLLKNLGETFKERRPLLKALENNPQRPLTTLNHALEEFNRASSPSKRRKSFSEIQRPGITEVEVRKSNYSLVTEPRDKGAYHEIISLNNDRYVCPFPACGITFLSQDATIRHMLNTHEQKTRLASSTPFSDAHLRFYWPRDVPWLTEKKFTEKKLPPGSLRCSHPGCPEIFATKLKLEAHLRLVHQQLHPSSIQLGYVIGEKMLHVIPPDSSPVKDGFNLEYCIYHAIPTRKCAKCMEIENYEHLPKPPFQLFDHFILDMSAKDDALAASIEGKRGHRRPRSAKGEENKHIVHSFDRNHAVILQSEQIGNGEEIRGKPSFMVVDRDHVAWMGILRLFTKNELMANGLVPFTVNQSLNSRYELFLESSFSAKSSTQWFPVHVVKKIFPVHYLNKQVADSSTLSAGSFFIYE
jgi:hypothetical protein